MENLRKKNQTETQSQWKALQQTRTSGRQISEPEEK
jgi:hypothetical protein